VKFRAELLGSTVALYPALTRRARATGFVLP
jgi:hypothetical protein